MRSFWEWVVWTTICTCVYLVLLLAMKAYRCQEAERVLKMIGDGAVVCVVKIGGEE